jgi:hypothetical protein
LTIACEILQDHAARDNIRWIHLSAESSGTLNSIISSLTACDGIRCSSVESVIIRYRDERESPVVSDFLAYPRFPKLRRLALQSCTISSWEFITSNTSVLTTLTLDSGYPTPTITSPQILSTLRSDPSIQEVALAGSAIPEDDGGNSRVPLTQLRKIALTGRRWGVLTPPHQLDYPRNMDSLVLTYGITQSKIYPVPSQISGWREVEEAFLVLIAHVPGPPKIGGEVCWAVRTKFARIFLKVSRDPNKFGPH